MDENLVLSTRKLSFSYGSRNVLKDFSMELKQGEFLSIIGANGAGKSTIVKLLSGFIKPLSGDVFLQGKPIATIKNRERATLMAVLGQKTTINLPYSVREIVSMGRAGVKGFLSFFSKSDCDIVDEVIMQMDIKHLEHRQMDLLSGGEQQLVLIAAVLAQQPKVLVLDEPTSALDLGHALNLMAKLKELQKNGLAILIISHDLQLMAEWTDTMILLKNGQILQQGTPRQVMNPDLIENAYGCKVKIIYDKDDNFVAIKNCNF